MFAPISIATGQESRDAPIASPSMPRMASLRRVNSGGLASPGSPPISRMNSNSGLLLAQAQSPGALASPSAMSISTQELNSQIDSVTNRNHNNNQHSSPPPQYAQQTMAMANYSMRRVNSSVASPTLHPSMPNASDLRRVNSGVVPTTTSGRMMRGGGGGGGESNNPMIYSTIAPSRSLTATAVSPLPSLNLAAVGSFDPTAALLKSPFSDFLGASQRIGLASSFMNNHRSNDELKESSSTGANPNGNFKVSSTATTECDYDSDPTELYLGVQNKQWDLVIRRASDHPSEVSTWVCRKENDGQTLRWRLLPVHAAIVFQAPSKVMGALLNAFVYGAQCKDDQGKLPIHLCFRRDTDEEVISLLVQAFPQSISARDDKGRTPLMLARLSDSPQRDVWVCLLESFASNNSEGEKGGLLSVNTSTDNAMTAMVPSLQSTGTRPPRMPTATAARRRANTDGASAASIGPQQYGMDHELRNILNRRREHVDAVNTLPIPKKSDDEISEQGMEVVLEIPAPIQEEPPSDALSVLKKFRSQREKRDALPRKESRLSINCDNASQEGKDADCDDDGKGIKKTIVAMAPPSLRDQMRDRLERRNNNNDNSSQKNNNNGNSSQKVTSFRDLHSSGGSVVSNNTRASSSSSVGRRGLEKKSKLEGFLHQHSSTNGLMASAPTSSDDVITVASSICSSTVDGRSVGGGSVGSFGNYFSLKKSEAWECPLETTAEREDEMMLTMDQEQQSTTTSSSSIASKKFQDKYALPEATPKRNNDKPLSFKSDMMTKYGAIGDISIAGSENGNGVSLPEKDEDDDVSSGKHFKAVSKIEVAGDQEPKMTAPETVDGARFSQHDEDYNLGVRSHQRDPTVDAAERDYANSFSWKEEHDSEEAKENRDTYMAALERGAGGLSVNYFSKIDEDNKYDEERQTRNAVRAGASDQEPKMTAPESVDGARFSQHNEDYNLGERSHQRDPTVAATDRDYANRFSWKEEEHDNEEEKENRETYMAALERGAGGLSVNYFSKIDEENEYDEERQTRNTVSAAPKRGAGRLASKIDKDTKKLGSWQCGDEPEIYASTSLMTASTAEMTEVPSNSYEECDLSEVYTSRVYQAKSNDVSDLKLDSKQPADSHDQSKAADDDKIDPLEEDLSTPKLLMRLEKFRNENKSFFVSPVRTDKELGKELGNDDDFDELATPNLMKKAERFFSNTEDPTDDQDPAPSTPIPTLDDAVLPSTTSSTSSVNQSKFDQIMAKYESMAFDVATDKTETPTVRKDFRDIAMPEAEDRSEGFPAPRFPTVFRRESESDSFSLPSVPSIKRSASKVRMPGFAGGLAGDNGSRGNTYRHENHQSDRFFRQQSANTVTVNPSPISGLKLQPLCSHDSGEDFFMNIHTARTMDSDAVSTLSRATGCTTIGSVSFATTDSAEIESYVQSVVHHIVAQEVENAGSMKKELEAALKSKIKLETRVKKLAKKSDEQSVNLKKARKDKKMTKEKFNREMEIHLTRKASELKSYIELALEQAEQSKRRAVELAQRDMEKEVSLLRSQLDTVQSNGVPIDRSLQSALELVESNQRALRDAAENDAKSALDMKKEIEQSFVSAVGEFESWSDKQLKLMEAKWERLRGSN